jgi:hypothetical protein
VGEGATRWAWPSRCYATDAMRLLPTIVLPAMSLLVIGCLAVDGVDESTSGVATRGQSSTVDHGELPRPIDARTEVALSARDRVHLWHVTLDGPARVAIRTERVERSRAIDTVLALYRQTASGWRVIARDDDGGDGPFSALSRDLPAGHYRIRVAGYTEHVRGRFALTVGCAGDGCGEAPPACVFGGTFREIDRDRFEFPGHTELTAASPLDPLTAAQVVRAVQASAHSDVTTPAEAFERVDQHEINRIPLRDTARERDYIAYEYGAGDNSYGAIFPAADAEPVAEIHDGDLVDCTATDEE